MVHAIDVDIRSWQSFSFFFLKLEEIGLLREEAFCFFSFLKSEDRSLLGEQQSGSCNFHLM